MTKNFVSDACAGADIHPKVLWNFFARPFAVAGRQFKRLESRIDAFQFSGKGAQKKKEPNPLYSEPYFCLGPDSLLPPA